MTNAPANGQPRHSILRRAARYALGVLLVSLATLFTRKTQPILGEISPLFFAAVAVSTWFGGLGPALLATALAGWASAYFFYNIPAGSGAFGWDDVLRLSLFLMVALLMSSLMHLRQRAEESLRKLNDQLEQRVRERTSALETSMRRVVESVTEQKRLEREVLQISESEQQRIGQDLHDGLGQELTGLAFLSQNLARKLAAKSLPEAAEEAQRITSLVTHAIEQTRELARGLFPVELGSDGLVAALRSLADQVQKNCGIPLDVHLDDDVRIEDHNAAVHLYRIVQEALTNAARHSRATRIWLTVEDVDRSITASVEDNGSGIPVDISKKKGLGLRLMVYRSRVIGAMLTISKRERGGSVVRCVYRNPLDARLTRSDVPNGSEQAHLDTSNANCG